MVADTQQHPLLTQVKAIHRFFGNSYLNSNVDLKIKTLTDDVKKHFAVTKGIKTTRDFTNTNNAKDLIYYLIRSFREVTPFGDERTDTLAVLFDNKTPCNCMCSTMMMLLICEQLKLVPNVVTAASNLDHIWVILANQKPEERLMFETTALPNYMCIRPLYDGGFFSVLKSIEDISYTYLSNMIIVNAGSNDTMVNAIEMAYPPGTKKSINSTLLFKNTISSKATTPASTLGYAKDIITHFKDRSRMSDLDIFNNRVLLLTPLLVFMNYDERSEFRDFYNYINDGRFERVLNIQIVGIPNPLKKSGTGRQSGKRRNQSRDILETILKERKEFKAMIAEYAALLGLDPASSLLLRSTLVTDPEDVLIPPPPIHPAFGLTTTTTNSSMMLITTANFLRRRRDLLGKYPYKQITPQQINTLVLGARKIK